MAAFEQNRDLTMKFVEIDENGKLLIQHWQYKFEQGNMAEW